LAAGVADYFHSDLNLLFLVRIPWPE
jgi:hypothetical protein